MTHRVILTEDEERLATYLGKSRAKVNRSSGVSDKKIGPQDGKQADIDAMGAEMAAAKYLNVFPDLTLGPRQGTADLRLIHKNYTIDVKHTKIEGGNLLAALWKKLEHSDIYILVTGTMPTYNVVGWAWNYELLNKRNVGDLGYGSTYIMGQKDLRSFEGEQV